jgi:hypothetical protein
MSQHRVRIVVGEGRSARMGFLRFVLQSEGYQVVAQASSAGELARVLAEHRPDVVVLDDGIGATAVQMTHDVSPESKVILVWPGAVVPIGGDARVEPNEVLRALGPAVARAVGPISASFETISKPAWIDRVQKDPATVRERLDQRGGLPTERPSVTELQRQVHAEAADEGEAVGDEALAPVVPLSRLSLPPAVWASTIDLTEAEEAEGEAVAAGSEVSEWNRRIGMIALGGAVAASAVVVALALGNSGRVGILSANGTFPPPSTAPAPGAALNGSDGQASVVTGLEGVFPTILPSPSGGFGGGPHGGGNTGGNPGGGTNTGGGNTGGGNTGGGNTGGGNPGGGVTRAPLASAVHNPFGRPPGQARSHGNDGGSSPGNSAAAHEHAAQRGNSAHHASPNGLAHRHQK